MGSWSGIDTDKVLSSVDQWELQGRHYEDLGRRLEGFMRQAESAVQDPSHPTAKAYLSAMRSAMEETRQVVSAVGNLIEGTGAGLRNMGIGLHRMESANADAARQIGHAVSSGGTGHRS